MSEKTNNKNKENTGDSNKNDPQKKEEGKKDSNNNKNEGKQTNTTDQTKNTKTEDKKDNNVNEKNSNSSKETENKKTQEGSKSDKITEEKKNNENEKSSKTQRSDPNISKEKIKEFKEKEKRREKSSHDSREHKIKKSTQEDLVEFQKKVVIKEPSPVLENINDLKKEDIIIRIKEMREKAKMYQEEQKKKLEDKMKELESKEKSITQITVTNTKLEKTIEQLKKEVDERLDKVIIEKGNKNIKKVKIEDPYEKILKIKEKELKNASKLIEILKKDKENLINTLNERADFKQITDYEDKLKATEKRNNDLSIEVETLKKMVKEHKVCVEMKENFEKNKKSLKDEIHSLKDRNREGFVKLKEEEFKHQKTKDDLLTIKRDLEVMKKDSEKMKSVDQFNLKPIISEKAYEQLLKEDKKSDKDKLKDEDKSKKGNENNKNDNNKGTKENTEGKDNSKSNSNVKNSANEKDKEGNKNVKNNQNKTEEKTNDTQDDKTQKGQAKPDDKKDATNEKAQVNSYTPSFIYNDPHIPKKDSKGLSPKHTKNQFNTEPQNNKDKNGKYYSKSLNALRQKIKEQEDEGIVKLFSEEEKKKMEKMLTKEEIETIEGRYEASQRAKIVNERKLKIEKKTVLKQISELEEQLKYLTLNLRESEQKSKIFLFQINDFKSEIGNQGNQLQEMNMTIDVVGQLLREKEQENKILLLQIHNLKKITKHNSLAPINSQMSQNIKKSIDDKKAKKNQDEDDDEKKNKKTEEDDDDIDDLDDDGNISDDQTYKIKAQKNKGIDS